MDSPLAPTVAPSTLAPPPLPPKPANPRRRLTWIVVTIVIAALLVYSWIEVQGSISELIHGLFAPNGLFRKFIPDSLPPTWSQLWPGFKAACVTLSIAILSIAFGMIWSLAMLPFAARNI